MKKLTNDTNVATPKGALLDATTIKAPKGLRPGAHFGGQVHALAMVYREFGIRIVIDGVVYDADALDEMAATQTAAEDEDNRLLRAYLAEHVPYATASTKRAKAYSAALNSARALLRGNPVAAEMLKAAAFVHRNRVAAAPTVAPASEEVKPTK